MKYMGSKSRIKKYIVPILQEQINSQNILTYIEPFVGGANIIDSISCNNKIGYDINKYLIALLNHVKSGGEFPEFVSREHYSEVRSNMNNFPDWYVGCIGFLSSYNGRFFDGGYSGIGYEKTTKGIRERNYYLESKNNILLQADKFKTIEFYCKSYLELSIKNSLIYCDPPYQGQKQYDSSKGFDHDLFWDKIREWSKDNIVIVSELNAPCDFKQIWSKEVNRSIKATDKSVAVERLFIYDDH